MKKITSFVVFILCLLSTVNAQETNSMDCMKQFIGTWEGETTGDYFKGSPWEKMKFKMSSDLGGGIIQFESHIKLKGEQEWKKNATGFIIGENATGNASMNVAWDGGNNLFLTRGKLTCKNNVSTSEINFENAPFKFTQKCTWTLNSENEFVNEFTDFIEGREPTTGSVVLKRKN